MSTRRRHRRNCNEPGHAHGLTFSCYRGYQFLKAERTCVWLVESIAFLEAEAPEWIPRITRKRGKKTERLFWQSGGGYDRNVTEPRTLREMIDYIHLNPVRRGLVERPEDWKWSSAAWFLGVGDSPLRLDPIPPEWLVEG
jgi:putative transposase